MFDRLWAEYPHTTLKASGEAVGLPPGQMGNSEVGHLTIGSGRVLDQDLQRVNRSIEDGSFFENPALQARRSPRAATSTCSAWSPTAASTRTSTTCRRCCASRPERTWIHAFTDGRDVSPTSAAPTSPSCRPSGSPPWSAATTRWTATSAGSEPSAPSTRSSRARASTRAGSGRGGRRRATTRGVTDEFIEPIVLEGRPRLEPGDAAIFFNFRPDRAPAARPEAARGAAST